MEQSKIIDMTETYHYHALLGRTAFTRLNAILHYAYLKLKMPGPRGVITVNGNMERSLRTEKDTAALAAEAHNGLFKLNSPSIIKTVDTPTRLRRTPQCGSSDKPELD